MVTNFDCYFNCFNMRERKDRAIISGGATEEDKLSKEASKFSGVIDDAEGLCNDGILSIREEEEAAT